MKRFLATVLCFSSCRQLCGGGGLGPGSCRGWDRTSKGRVAVRNCSPELLVLGRRWNLTCLTEVRGQDRVVGWVWVAYEFLPLHFDPRAKHEGSDGWYCHPMGQHPSLPVKGRSCGACLFLSFLLLQCPGCPQEQSVVYREAVMAKRFYVFGR